MPFRNQRTLKKEVVISGIGTHTGKKSLIRLLPARCNTGVNFLSKRGVISANPFSISDSTSNTTLKNNGFYVETVEHLLSCLYGLSVDNVDVEVTGRELPIGDGSARHFYDAILDVGIEKLNCQRMTLVISKSTTIRKKPNRLISISPAKNYSIDCSLDWHPKIVGNYIYVHEGSNYSEIAYARTFADKKYAKRIAKLGGAKGAKFGVNCIDINSDSAIMENEFVKHKTLDIIGDLSLLYQMNIHGKVVSVNSGHAMHHELIKGIFNGV